jgi:ABC-type antimicrobial peptide transport system permease subunit
MQAVRESVAAVDPLVPITIEPLEARTSEPLAERRLMLTLASGFAVVALLLAGAGVYAMVAFAVGRQMRESAIRLALGASPASLRRRVLLQGLAPAAAGIAGGLVLGIPVGRAMRAQLFHVQPLDPVVLSCTIAAVVLAAAAAAAAPARRAARIDPAEALRQD